MRDPTTLLTVTNDGRVIAGDGLTMDEAAVQFLRACSGYVTKIEYERDAARTRAMALDVEVSKLRSASLTLNSIIEDFMEIQPARCDCGEEEFCTECMLDIKQANARGEMAHLATSQTASGE